MVNNALNNQPHIIDNRQVDPKRATPREASEFMSVVEFLLISIAFMGR